MHGEIFCNLPVEVTAPHARKLHPACWKKIVKARPVSGLFTCVAWWCCVGPVYFHNELVKVSLFANARPTVSCVRKVSKMYCRIDTLQETCPTPRLRSNCNLNSFALVLHNGTLQGWATQWRWIELKGYTVNSKYNALSIDCVSKLIILTIPFKRPFSGLYSSAHHDTLIGQSQSSTLQEEHWKKTWSSWR